MNMCMTSVLNLEICNNNTVYQVRVKAIKQYKCSVFVSLNRLFNNNTAIITKCAELTVQKKKQRKTETQNKHNS